MIETAAIAGYVPGQGNIIIAQLADTCSANVFIPIAVEEMHANVCHGNNESDVRRVQPRNIT